MCDTMDRMIDKVVQMKETYEELLGLSLRKKDAIDRGDVADLDRIVEAEELLLLHIGSLENERRQIAEKTAKENGMEPEDLTLATWPGVDGTRREAVEQLQHAFMETLSEITRVNEINSRLLSIQLEYIRQVVDAVTDTRRDASYEPDGTARPRVSQQTNLLDRTL
ncbi:MAG: flagellar protein FlgN [Clostridiaceae bacterium]|jgi:flagellar biosynthesis/type III secretory pathway chaperone|nr:flagellar protein FlgN [Clostridiaceae bacterium]